MTVPLRLPWAPIVSLNPVVAYPAKLDLGEHEIGDLAVSRFTIANRGNGELVIDQIRTNCSCTGMEREQDNEFVQVKSLRLRGGEQANLVMRVSVRGVPVGAEMLNVVEFQTNDPSQPTGRIEAIVRRVSGGVVASPESVVFGTVPVGATVRKLIDIRDNALLPRLIERVTSTMPERVTVRLQPVRDGPREANPPPEGAVVARLEVNVETAAPGEVDAVVQVYLAGEARTRDAVTVVGRVAAPIEISPGLLILPRASSSGPVYSATCICRSTAGEPLVVIVDSVPPGLTADVLAQDCPKLRSVRVTWDPSQGKVPTGRERQVIRLRAKAGDNEVVLELPVLLQT
jgi:hypothetical protein